MIGKYLGAILVEQSKKSKMNVFELLNLRTEWEELAQDLKVDIDSSVSGLKRFVENGHKNNRFRKGYKEAVEIAEKILENV